MNLTIRQSLQFRTVQHSVGVWHWALFSAPSHYHEKGTEPEELCGVNYLVLFKGWKKLSGMKWWLYLHRQFSKQLDVWYSNIEPVFLPCSCFCKYTICLKIYWNGLRWTVLGKGDLTFTQDWVMISWHSTVQAYTQWNARKNYIPRDGHMALCRLSKQYELNDRKH